MLALRDNYRSSFINENDYMVRLFNIWVFSQRKWDMDDKEDTSVPMFDAALFTIYRAEILHPGPFMAEWVKNIWYILNRILFTCRQMASYYLHWNAWNWKTTMLNFRQNGKVCIISCNMWMLKSLSEYRIVITKTWKV